MTRSTHGLLRVVAAVAVVIAVGATYAAAHDPGLSSTTVVVSADSLTAKMLLHNADLANLDGGALARVLTPHPDAPPLVVRTDGRELEVLRIESRDQGDDEITVEVTFPRPPAFSIEIDVALLASLPRGHKHLLEVRGTDGTVLATRILSAGAATLQVTLGR